MAFGYLSSDNESLIVYTEHKELGHKGGNWWAFIAFDVISNDKEDLSKDYKGREGYLNRWTFPASLELAVRRILDARERPFYLLTEAECKRRLKGLQTITEEA